MTKWYNAEKIIEVKLLGEGLYYAVGFMKVKDNEPSITISLPVQVLQERDNTELPHASVSIFGSCVSRDLLEYKAANHLSLDWYFARQSMVSAVAEKVSLDCNKININSKFLKRQIYYDFNKCVFDMLKEKKSDYIIIDLVDERFSLIKISGSYITRSVALLESGILLEGNPIIEKEEYVDEQGILSYRIEGMDIRKYLDEFCDRILHIYNSESIILHVVRGAEYYFDKNNNVTKFEPNIAGYYKRLNRMWNFMYEYLYRKMEGCICIDVCSGYLADENHVWGLSPIHFQKEYYERVLEEIRTKM